MIRSPLVTQGGVLLVDKAAGITSHDVVSIVRRAARERRVGHAGTLDPFATGLLVLAIGPATRVLSHIAAEPKVYDATIAFGAETDTDDSAGNIIREAPMPPMDLLMDPKSPDRLAAQASLTGLISQVPPSYSAKQLDGVRAYKMARSGKDVELPAVTVRVDKWDWLGSAANRLDVRITCGGGTYIRALARDLGRALGSAAHCYSLRRIASGPATVENAVPSASLEPGCIAEGRVTLRSPLELLTLHEQVHIDSEMKQAIMRGRTIEATREATGAAAGEAAGSAPKAALVFDGLLVALAERVDGNRWQPRVVLAGAGGS